MRIFHSWCNETEKIVVVFFLSYKRNPENYVIVLLVIEHIYIFTFIDKETKIRYIKIIRGITEDKIMSTEKCVMELLWDLFNKMIWLNEQSLKKALNGYKPSEIHCLDYIGTHSESNVTQLANAFYMTRGAISKLTKKLIDKGLIDSYQKSGNKKEIYFCLTKKGKEIFDIHERLHHGFDERDKFVFEQMAREEMENVYKFAEIYNEHLDNELLKLGLDMKSAEIDKL